MLISISINKEFIPSIANTIGTDFSSYKIVRTGQFAYGPVTSRNGEKVSIALLRGSDCIISSSYVPFEVYKLDELLPEYLMLWFMRPEFDRYARFMSNGSAREVFDWDSMCGVELPVPPIEEQRKIVHDYQVIADRIALLKAMNGRFAELLYTEFQRKFQLGKDLALNGTPLDGWQVAELSNYTEFMYGKMVPEENKCESGYPVFSGYGITGYYHEYLFSDPHIVVLARGVSGTGEVRISPKYSYITNLSIAMCLHDNSYFAYFYEYLGHDNLRSLDSGSAQSMITIDSLNKYVVAVPPKQLAIDFNNCFQRIYDTVESNSSEVESLKKLSLIQLERLAKGV